LKQNKIKNIKHDQTDAYFLTDGTLFYEVNKVRLAFKVNNIGNQKIWGINDNPLSTRNFADSVKYQFLKEMPAKV